MTLLQNTIIISIISIIIISIIIKNSPLDLIKITNNIFVLPRKLCLENRIA